MGNKHLVSVLFTLYKTNGVYGAVPRSRNAAIFHLIWKAKGGCDDVKQYCLTAVVNTFRKFYKKIIMVQGEFKYEYVRLNGLCWL